MKKIFIFILVICLYSTLFSDEIILKNGDIFRGTISSASMDLIIMDTEIGLEEIEKSQILTIVFSNADILYLKTDESVACKVIDKEGSEIIVVTPEGVRKVENHKIKKVNYNTGRELKVTEIPETGRQFKNKPSSSVWTGDFKKSVNIRLLFASHFASLKDWEDQFVIYSAETPSFGWMVAGGLNYAFNKNFKFGLGYEYFSSRTVEISGSSLKDWASYTYIYGTIFAGGSPETMPNLFIYGAVDLGSLTGYENAESSGASLELSGTKFVPRIKVGVDYFTSNNTSVFSEIGYLIADIDDLEFNGVKWPFDYSLDFSGICITFGVEFHIAVP